MEIDIEFAVSDLSDKSLEAIRGNLKDAGSIRVNHEASTIVVKTNQAWHLIKSRIEDTGASAALSGYSAGLAGVAVLDKGSDEIKGVVRFGVVDSGCVIDGTIDGLKTLTDYTFSLMELGLITICQIVCTETIVIIYFRERYGWL